MTAPITVEQRTLIRHVVESGDGVFTIADEPVVAFQPATIIALLDALDDADTDTTYWRNRAKRAEQELARQEQPPHTLPYRQRPGAPA